MDDNTSALLLTHLSAARSALEQAIPLLDDRGAVCGCCGLTKRESFGEHQLAVALRGMVERLVKYETGVRRGSV